ncbi:MAG: hypothetical protein WDA08_00575 [Weeksellaceae bacterium]
MKLQLIALSFILFNALISCKNEIKEMQTVTENPVVTAPSTPASIEESGFEEAVKAVTDLSGFTNPELKEFAQNYLKYADDLYEAARRGDQEKTDELNAVGLNYAKQIQKFNQSLSAEEAQQLNDWTRAVALAYSK